jgi:hypothetical protein
MQKFYLLIMIKAGKVLDDGSIAAGMMAALQRFARNNT